MKLFTKNEWTLNDINRTWKTVDKIARNEYGLDYEESIIEIVTPTQMLEAMAFHGLPHAYPHWSIGRDYLREKNAFTKRGGGGLAYEMIINTSPPIAYFMDSNTMSMQCVVLCHANVGHAAFFKNNYFFKENKVSFDIISHLQSTKEYILECEIEYGQDAVEVLLDWIHALKYYGIDRYKRNNKSEAVLLQEKEDLERDSEQYVNMLYNLDAGFLKDAHRNSAMRRIDEYFMEDAKATYTSLFKAKPPTFPEENLLYFAEKYCLHLDPWQREVIRRVRLIYQYLYPQMFDKVLNEGFATFWHYELMTHLFDKSLITESTYMEFLVNHSKVIFQREYHSKYGYGGINPYALGFSFFKNLKRICTNPDDDERERFDLIIGRDWKEVIPEVAYNYRDESAIKQFLSPRTIEEFSLFVVQNKEDSNFRTVSAVVDEEDYKAVRDALAYNYNFTNVLPTLEIVDYSVWPEACATIEITRSKNQDVQLSDQTIQALEGLFGDNVQLRDAEDRRKV